MPDAAPHIVIIGAGIGGLASALRLAHAGARVTVLERHATPGGKMRTVDSAAGPVDAGPTVLTMKHVFEALFSNVGARLEDHVTLLREDLLARHFWADGTQLDLMADPDHSHENVAITFGQTAADQFTEFSDRARDLFTSFDTPMMQTPAPTLAGMTATVLKNPKLIPAIAPHLTLEKSLKTQFAEPKLAQLFARYATYVGGVPKASPAILGLIWHAESQGVWHVQGGMHRLARAIEALAISKGATFQYNTHVERIETSGVVANGAHIPCDAILFNGDPNALRAGHLGPLATTAVPEKATSPRSLSAYVHAFAAKAQSVPLAAHNVFFADDPDTEYDALTQGAMQPDPTLYICAQDRFGGQVPSGAERIEIIMNAAPTGPHDATSDEKERHRCQTLIIDRLRHFGVQFSPRPDQTALTMPREFDQMFPASTGSLYGRSPHGMMAAFARPTARTRIKGLYLTGGGAHPGAGIPMATLSAMHAAEAIKADLISTSTSQPVDTPGGTLTASATVAPVPSRS